MDDAKTQAIEALMKLAFLADQYGSFWRMERDQAGHVVDALLSATLPAPCEMCGGAGELVHAHSGKDLRFACTAPGCVDGTVTVRLIEKLAEER